MLGFQSGVLLRRKIHRTACGQSRRFSQKRMSQTSADPTSEPISVKVGFPPFPDIQIRSAFGPWLPFASAVARGGFEPKQDIQLMSFSQ